MVKKARLGADPFKWIQDSREKKSDNSDQVSKQENIDNPDVLNKQEKPELQEKTEVSSKSEVVPGGWQRATFIIREKHLEKIKAIAYWDRLQIKEVMEEALEEYLAKKDVKPMPPRRKI